MYSLLLAVYNQCHFIHIVHTYYAHLTFLILSMYLLEFPIFHYPELLKTILCLQKWRVLT